MRHRSFPVNNSDGNVNEPLTEPIFSGASLFAGDFSSAFTLFDLFFWFEDSATSMVVAHANVSMLAC